MGLLLSVLVGCVGVLELLTCLNRVSHRSITWIDPPTTCLSYHDRPQGGFTIHDSLCGIGHSRDLDLSSGAKYKLENLHEYSLRIRSELRSKDQTFDGNTLTDCSTTDLLARSESKIDPDFESLSKEFGESTEIITSTLAEKSEEYFRVPTPISIIATTRKSESELSNESDISFDEDILEKRVKTKTFDVSLVRDTTRYEESPLSGNESDYEDTSILKKLIQRSKSPDVSKKFDSIESSKIDTEVDKNRQLLKRSKIKPSTTIVRKATRLKSKNARISKSAENLSTKKSKRQREPERRKSDISVQTSRNIFKDEWTNTSPPGSPSLSRSESRASVSVQVQTSFEERPFVEKLETVELQVENPALGLSESKRDLYSREKRAKSSFKRRRFRSASTETTSTDDCADPHVIEYAIASVERSYNQDHSNSLKISTFEEASRNDYGRVRDIIFETESTTRNDGGREKKEPVLFFKSMSSFEDDEEYVSAEDVSSIHGKGHIEYTTPDTDRNKAFWIGLNYTFSYLSLSSKLSDYITLSQQLFFSLSLSQETIIRT
ncbi:uncharacterized protein LOC124952593 isoform X2 [Vespa velutina]|uniref:uncharacterized protein LOC124952593 isoform X2 n=1 Tax=Vespa velutina TaxID=202808 RepID=UPI001FB51F7B|nr:uncharacterized protein LOC124952593 isoform X2 [Vespa velutina]